MDFTFRLAISIQCDQMPTRTIVNENAWEAVAGNMMFRLQGNEIKPQEGCDNYQHRDKKKSFSRKMVEDQTCESRVQGKEGKPPVVKFPSAQSSAKQKKSLPTKSH